jgi:hypothetical protein
MPGNIRDRKQEQLGRDQQRARAKEKVTLASRQPPQLAIEVEHAVTAL